MPGRRPVWGGNLIAVQERRPGRGAGIILAVAALGSPGNGPRAHGQPLTGRTAARPAAMRSQQSGCGYCPRARRRIQALVLLGGQVTQPRYREAVTVDLFAGLPVGDYQRALTWDERLLSSEAAFFPNATV